MKQRGFTLVEVMVGLAILATALVVLVSVTAADIREAQRAQMLNVATMLARGKLFDVEEELLKEGFQPTDQESEGDFREEGWEQIKWRIDVRLIELPNLTGVSGEEGAAGAEGDASANPLAGMLSSFGLGGDIGGAESAGASLISSQFQIIQEVLKQSIRKISLRIEWVAFGPDNCTESLRERIRKCFDEKGGCDDTDLNQESIRCEEVVVDYYVTDPAAISRVVGGVGAAAGGDPGGTGDTGSTSGGSTSGGSTSGGSTGGTGTSTGTSRNTGGRR